MRLFWQKPSVGPLSATVTDALINRRGLRQEDTTLLRMVEEKGTYAGRPVTYFRVFNPASLRAAGIAVSGYGDLDSVPDLFAGHIEREKRDFDPVRGSVVLDGDSAWSKAHEPQAPQRVEMGPVGAGSTA